MRMKTMSARRQILWTPVFAGACCVLMSACAHAAPPDAKALAAISAAAPSKPVVQPQKARKILVYSRTTSFRHSSIETGDAALKILGDKTGAWTTTISEDPKAFADLSSYDAIVFLNTTGDPFRAEGFNEMSEAAKVAAKAEEDQYKANLLNFVNGGKGFVGIHSATDTFWRAGDEWPAFNDMIGGIFDEHPWGAGDDVTVRVEDPNSPIVKSLNGEPMSFKEEIYQFKAPYSRDKQRVLMGLDLEKSAHKDNLRRDDKDYAVTWIKPQGQGRVFYTSLGHREDKYSDARVLGVYLAGIQYAIGDLNADATPISLADARTMANAQMSPKMAQPATQYSDPVMGEYSMATEVDHMTMADAMRALPLVRIYPQGDGTYRAAILGLNGDAKNRVELNGKMQDNALTLNGQDGDQKLELKWDGGKTITLARGTDKAKLQTLNKIMRTSPTLGQKPPAGAIVLLPYEKGAKTVDLSAWTNDKWTARDDGSMQVGKGDNRTKQEFGDIKLHAEWLTPLLPDKRGQERGNSGIYLEDRYEVQVLDSFGLDSKDNDAGGLYKISKPSVNAGLPPGQWQTYDITFHAPRLKADGTQDKPARVTVVLNGTTIQDDVELPHPTGSSAAMKLATKAPLRLQDHGWPVRFRNLWVLPLDEQTAMNGQAQAPAQAGEKVLFNGENLDGWGKAADGPQIEDGVMHFAKGTGDIWTNEQYGDFVLDFDWKANKGANSGVFIRNPKPGDWYAGMEIQIKDSFGNNSPTREDAGGNYDVAAPTKIAVKAPGEWNHTQITAQGQNIRVMMNGELVLDQDLNQWKEAGKNPDGSKNKFGKAYAEMPRVGHIELQEHPGGDVWYRNLKVRALK